MTDLLACVMLALGILLGRSVGRRSLWFCAQCGRKLPPAERSSRLCSVECAQEAMRVLRAQLRENDKPLHRGRR